MEKLRAIIEYYISIEESEVFAEWAWGKEFRDLFYEELYQEWNRLHSDLLIINPDGYPEIDIPKMIDFWKKGLIHEN